MCLDLYRNSISNIESNEHSESSCVARGDLSESKEDKVEIGTHVGVRVWSTEFRTILITF